jgi:hypothetical protein
MFTEIVKLCAHLLTDTATPAYDSHRQTLGLSDDCLGLVIEFLDTRAWIQFSYTCREINAFKTVKHLMIHKKRTLIALPPDTEHTVDDILTWMRASSQTLFNVDFSMAAIFHKIDGSAIDDRFLAPLTGIIHTLDMSCCNQVTGTAFVHLRGIQVLNMQNCNQESITDEALRHLAGIHTLIMHRCTQTTITGAAIRSLSVHTLGISHCSGLTDAVFEPPLSVRRLEMWGCHKITNATRRRLRATEGLEFAECPIMMILPGTPEAHTSSLKEATASLESIMALFNELTE